MNDRVQITLDAEISSSDVLGTLFQPSPPLPGSETKLGNGEVVIKLLSQEEGLGFADPVSIQLLVSFGLGVASSLVAAGLYDAFGKAIRRLSLDGRHVRPSIDDLTKAIETIQRFAEYHAKEGKDTPEGSEGRE